MSILINCHLHDGIENSNNKILQLQIRPKDLNISDVTALVQ